MKPGTFAAVAALIVFVCLLSGCAVTRSVKSPAGESRAGGVAVSQTGDAVTPARAWSVTDAAELPIPAGSEVTLEPDTGRLTAKLSAPSTLRTEKRADHAEGPQAFTPPAPPTPSEEAAGRAAWFYRIAAFAGVVAAVFGFVRDWDFVAWGGVAVAAGGLFGVFIDRHPWLFAVIGGGLMFGVAGVLLWHLKLKRKELDRPPLERHAAASDPAR